MKKINNRDRSLVKLFVIPVGILMGSTLGYTGEEPAYPFEEHIDQHTIHEHSIADIYDWGLTLFKTHFNSLDGVGANLKLDPPDRVTKRFTRGPRADLPGWLANIVRPDGPQAQSCAECHNNERTGLVLNEERDPLRSGQIKNYIERSATALAGVGALQLLGEQTSKELWSIRDAAIAEASNRGSVIRKRLISSNRVDYGYISAYPDGTIDTSEVVGVDNTDDPLTQSQTLRVAPLHLKALAPFIRLFTTATDVTLGMQSPERYPEFLDGDSDGVLEELTVGDITAMTIAVAAEPRPVTKLELHRNVGGRYRLSRKEIRDIRRGERLFSEIGCVNCHKPKMRLKDPNFREPSSTPGFFFAEFWTTYIDPDGNRGGGNPLDYGYDIANPISFDITNSPSAKCKSRPYWWRNYSTDDNNRSESEYAGSFEDSDRGLNGNHRRPKEYTKGCWRQFESDRRGGAILRMYGDQKRYDMGEGLAEDVDEFGKGPSVFRTKELWGVGSTSPWLHDGRATTLTEAIFWHGGDAEDVKNNFFSLSDRQQDRVRAFLMNQVLYDYEKDKVVNEDVYKIY